MDLAKPLLRPVKFSNKIDFTWFELWHHEGRRARHGVSMMGPDYAHWHGTYEIARNFYHELLPELEELVEKGLHSKDETKQNAAKKLDNRINEILQTENHRWFINKMDTKDVKARQKRQQEFKKRYDK
jgi:hypothetical protein